MEVTMAARAAAAAAVAATAARAEAAAATATGHHGGIKKCGCQIKSLAAK
jgi:hypothetical protein